VHSVNAKKCLNILTQTDRFVVSFLLSTCSAKKEAIPNPLPLSRKGWLAPLSSTRRRGGGLRLPHDKTEKICVWHPQALPLCKQAQGLGMGVP
jgi:hypothetical protein